MGSGGLDQRRNVGEREKTNQPKSNCFSQQMVLGGVLQNTDFGTVSGEAVEDGLVGRTELNPWFLSLLCGQLSGCITEHQGG